MSINQIDLMKLFKQIKWADNGDLTPFSETNYTNGWAYLGDDTPTVEDFNAVQQWNDKKDQWLYNQIANVCKESNIELTETDLQGLLKAIKQIAKNHSTPKSITATTKNAADSTGHTHEIDLASITTKGLVQLNDSWESDSREMALTARVGKALKALIDSLTRNLSNYIPNSKKSDSVTSSSSDTVATSKAVKQLNDKLTPLNVYKIPVKAGGTPVTFDLSNREHWIAEIGSVYNGSGHYQLCLHNNVNSTISNLPLNDKSAVQLDISVMGVYTLIRCHYFALNRTFTSRFDWNKSTSPLAWFEEVKLDTSGKVPRDTVFARSLESNYRVVIRRNEAKFTPYQLFIDNAIDMTAETVSQKSIGEWICRVGAGDGVPKSLLKTILLADKNVTVEIGGWNAAQQYQCFLKGFTQTGNVVIGGVADDGSARLQVTGDINAKGSLVVTNQSWVKHKYPINNGGEWRMEFNPNSEADPRFNVVYKMREGAYRYCSFPKLERSEVVAYRSWVESQMAGKVSKSGDTMTGKLRIHKDARAAHGAGIDLINNGGEMNSGVHIDGYLAGFNRGGMHIVDRGGNAADIAFLTTPAGGASERREVHTVLHHNGGMSVKGYGLLNDYFHHAGKNYVSVKAQDGHYAGLDIVRQGNAGNWLSRIEALPDKRWKFFVEHSHDIYLPARAGTVALLDDVNNAINLANNANDNANHRVHKDGDEIRWLKIKNTGGWLNLTSTAQANAGIDFSVHNAANPHSSIEAIDVGGFATELRFHNTPNGNDYNNDRRQHVMTINPHGAIWAKNYGWLHDHFMKRDDFIRTWYPQHYHGAEVYKIRHLGMMITVMNIGAASGGQEHLLPEAYDGFAIIMVVDNKGGREVGGEYLGGNRIRVYGGNTISMSIIAIGNKNV